MKTSQITIRRVDPLLKSKIKQSARLRSLSVNEWVLTQLKKSVGSDVSHETNKVPDWKRFVGAFPEEVILNIEAAEEMDIIDESMWKQP